MSRIISDTKSTFGNYIAVDIVEGKKFEDLCSHCTLDL